MHLSEIWHSKKNDSRLSRTQVYNIIGCVPASMDFPFIDVVGVSSTMDLLYVTVVCVPSTLDLLYVTVGCVPAYYRKL